MPGEQETGASVATQVDVCGIRAWRSLLYAHAHATRLLESELEVAHGLLLASYDVLVQLAESPDGALRMSELAEAVLLSRSGLTRLVDRLERDGLVERRSCPSDARGTFATLTDAGRTRLREASGTHLRGVSQHVLSHFDQAELDVLADLLGRIAGPAAKPQAGTRCGQGA